MVYYKNLWFIKSQKRFSRYNWNSENFTFWPKNHAQYGSTLNTLGTNLNIFWVISIMQKLKKFTKMTLKIWLKWWNTFWYNSYKIDLLKIFMGKKFCHLKKFYDQTLMGSYPLKIFQKNFFSREKVLSSPHARHKPITCQTCKCILCRIDSRGSIGVHLRTCNILHGSSLSVRPVDQKRRQLAVGVCSK